MALAGSVKMAKLADVPVAPRHRRLETFLASFLSANPPSVKRLREGLASTQPGFRSLAIGVRQDSGPRERAFLPIRTAISTHCGPFYWQPMYMGTTDALRSILC